jgi:hypothetical protein
MNRFTTFRGDTFGLTINYKDNSGTAINITDYEIYFTVKFDVDDSDADAAIPPKLASLTNPSQGIATISLTHSETKDLSGAYFYDIQYKKPDGSIRTATKGIIVFDEDVTRVS